jgi:uncharacterized membrane protein
VAALAVSAGSVFVAGMTFFGARAPDAIAEAPPDWYVWFTAGLHGLILAFLLLFLAQLGRITAERPALRLPTLAALLVGIAAAVYVLAKDFNLV